MLRILERQATDRDSIEAFLTSLTMSRLLLLPPLVWGVFESPAIAVFSLLVIVVMDIGDGVIARAACADTAIRRVADAAVDKIAIHTASIAVVIQDPVLLPLYLPLAFRDGALVVANLWCIERRKTFISGRGRHRAASLAYAGLGFVALAGCPNPVVTVTAVIAWAVNYALVLDYWRTFVVVLKGAPHARLVVRYT
ncbi:MAG TPA: CDP-alcohol phosphatidyltransferase family protein [Solirubrobacterales bacterium]|nr:CDP-alcohol phosphatidyltransferase family protein [Solirubrobacterales bacterium]